VLSRLRLLHSVGKGPQQPVWCMDNAALATVLVYCAGLVEMLGELAERIEETRTRLDDIAAKAEVARAAELNWQAKVALPDEIVFGNLAGEVATLPIAFVRIYRAGHRLDATSIVVEGDRILVKDGGELITSMPKTLWVTLERVLEATTLPEDRP